MPFGRYLSLPLVAHIVLLPWLEVAPDGLGRTTCACGPVKEGSTSQNEPYAGKKNMRQCLRWRVEHDGEEKPYGSRGMLSERGTMKT